MKFKPIRDGLRAQKTEKAQRACREQHKSEFIISESVAQLQILVEKLLSN